MRKDQIAAGRAFAALHRAPSGFIMPNAWDRGSAIVLASLGFKALATTSAGVAFSLGKPDYDVTSACLRVSRDDVLARAGEMAAAVDVPMNGDLEAGYGDAPDAVADTIRRAIEAGLAGANIEDKIPGAPRLYDETLACERIAAAREAIGERPFVLTARTDALIFPGADAAANAIRRANLYRRAGADCLFPPGANDVALIKTLVREIEGPVNIVMGLGTSEGNAHALIEAGVARISLGGTFARAALSFLRDSAREVMEKGTLRFADAQMPHGELNALFSAKELERNEV